MMQIYGLKNVKVGFWNPPTFGQMDKDSTKVNLYRYCLLNQEEALKAHYDECELYWLGTFDDVRCKVDLAEEPEFLIDLKECFKHE